MNLGRISMMITLLAGLSMTAPNTMPARAAKVDGAAVERLFRPDDSLTWINRTTANGLGSEYVSSVFASGNLVYAATYGGLSISTDGGATFANKTTADGLGSILVYGVSASGSTLYAATPPFNSSGGLSVSTDGGSSFTTRTTADGLGSNNVRDVFATGNTVYVANHNGLSISTDGGDSFTNKTVSDGLGDNSVYGVFASGGTVYAATVHGLSSGGLSVSTNGGDTFANKTIANGLGSNDVIGVYASGGTVYAATAGGLSISTDGGNTFTNRTTANGLGSNQVYGVFASGNMVYTAEYGGGVSISDDGGNTFYHANGILSNVAQRVFGDNGRVYAATQGGLSIGVPANVTPTAVTLSSSRNPSIYGITVTFTATVSAAGDSPTGTVAFKNNGVAIPGCISPALSSGRATCMTSSLTVGTHTIYANYNGNARFGASAVTLSGGQVVTQITPLIFVHGVAGSTLVKNGSPIWIGIPFVTSRRELSLVDSPPASVIAADAIRDVLGVKPIYGPLLDYLVDRGGYVEYEVDGIPARRTVAGCNTGQSGAKPNLFVFAYDWRVDNDANADKLKEYIGCAQLFYPGSKVNLLAHSMGGLLSRRYILKYYNGAQANNGHRVNALITIGSPFLGAPKLSYVLETGDFIGDPPIATGHDVKYAAQTLTAAHQLLPSRRYADVSGVVPLAEAGWDLDADGIPSETYNYDDMLDVMDIRYPNTPGATGDAFHGYTRASGGQDDWSADSTGVKYAHIYGVRSVADTIGQVQARIAIACSSANLCATTHVFMPAYTIGDGTVPARSATKQGNGFNYNAPGAQLFRYFGPSANGDGLTEHTGLTQNPLVQAKILELITQTTGSLAGLARSQPEIQDEAVLPAHYLLINGATRVIVYDALGKSTAPLQGDQLGNVPGATDTSIGDHVSMLTLAASGDYTVTFDTTERPLATELTTGTDVSTTQIMRYLDLSLPISVTAMLRLRLGEIEPLRYDADRNGSFESVLTPTVNVSGTTALDTTPPTLTLTATGAGATRQVTITAQDDGSGVKNLRYSVNGTDFQPYTSTVTFDWTAYPTLYAMSDDNMANRGVVAFAIGKSTYLPLMIR